MSSRTSMPQNARTPDSLLIARRLAAWFGLSLALCNPVAACYYTDYGFDPDKKSQTTVFGLINNRYREPDETDKSFYRSELERFQRNKKTDDADWSDTYAFLLLRNGQLKEAFAIWEGLIAKDPTRYGTLCNIGTALHNQAKHDEAIAYLEKAIKLKPGFRSGAEELHVEMIKYQQLIRTNYKAASERLFLDSLTRIWKERKPLPATFEDVEQFPQIEADGLAELLRQFPKFGDGWLALGMVLEHDGEHYLANRAYERAAKYANTQSIALRDRLLEYTPYASERDPTRRAGHRIKWAILIAFGAFIMWWLVLMVRRVVLDYTSDKKNKKAPPRKPPNPDSGGGPG